MKTISIVIPFFTESLNLGRLYEELVKIRSTLTSFSWEFVFVNDGSTDDTWEKMTQLAKNDPSLKVIDLSRNHGKEIALSAGTAYAVGDAVICMDADLQHPPSCILEMVKAWESGAEVVEMVRVKSEGEPLFRKLGSYLFYFFLNKISDFPIKPHTTDFRLLDRKVVNAFTRIREKRRMFRGLIDWMGFRRITIEFTANERTHGDPGYSFSKLIGLAMTSFISYSTAPLRFIGWFGGSVTLLSGLLLATMVGFSLFAPNVFHFTPLAMVAVANTFLMGLVLSALGLISLYIIKIYEEARERPLFIIRDAVNLSHDSDSRMEYPSKYGVYSPHIDLVKGKDSNLAT